MVATLWSPIRAEAADLVLSVGAFEAIEVPDAAHLGAYPYVAASLAVPVGDVALIPGLGIEYSPDASRWGVVASLVLDVPLTKRFAADVIVAAAHDQAGWQWSDAILLAGGGVGVSITTEHVVISPSVCVFAALDGSGWSLVPGVSFAHVF